MKPDQPKSNDLEFLISRLVDGDLEEGSRRVLEDQLADDAELRALQRDFASIDRELKRLPVVPETNWKQFESQVLGKCLQSQRETARYRMYRWAGGLMAAAAAVALVSTVTLRDAVQSNEATMVALVSVGPKQVVPQGVTKKLAAVEFAFSRGGKALPEPVIEEPAQQPHGTLIVATAMPLMGNANGMWSGEGAF